MNEIAGPLIVAGLTACGWMAWNHPKAYSKLAPWLAGGAFVLGLMVYGIQLGFIAGIDRLRPDLTAVQITKADAFVRAMQVKTDPWLLGLFFGGLFLWLLLGLNLLPRGRD
jgi:hypothetical protein